MQIPTVPPPIMTTTLPQEMVNKAVHNLHVQAVPPLLQSAVAPAPKSEKSNQSRSDKEKSGRNRRGDDDKKQNTGGRGSEVNIRV